MGMAIGFASLAVAQIVALVVVERWFRRSAVWWFVLVCFLHLVIMSAVGLASWYFGWGLFS